MGALGIVSGGDTKAQHCGMIMPVFIGLSRSSSVSIVNDFPQPLGVGDTETV